LKRITVDNSLSVDFEHIVLEINQKCSHPLYLILIYCSPNKTQSIRNCFFNYFEDILDNECIILGDFNIDVNNNDNNEWLNTVRDNGFSQLIDTFTRVTETSATTLDHIYVNKSNNISGSGILQFSLSDHQPIYLKRKLNIRIKVKTNIHKSIKYFDYKNIDYKTIEHKLSEMKIEVSQNVNHICTEFTLNFHSLMRNNIPVKNIRVKREKPNEWISEEIIKSMKVRDKLKKEIISEKKISGVVSEHLFKNYKLYRNLTIRQISKSKRNYFHSKIKSCKGDNKQLWKLLSNVIPTKNSRKSKSQNNTDLTPEDFKNYFTTEQMKIVEEYVTNEMPYNETENFTSKTFSLPTVTEDNVSKLINHLKPKKSLRK
jgi:hypothetical protein